MSAQPDAGTDLEVREVRMQAAQLRRMLDRDIELLNDKTILLRQRIDTMSKDKTAQVVCFLALSFYWGSI
jgi:hypothetical protein